MLTYALGRGLDYHDTLAVDVLVDRLEKENGRASTLLIGIIESTPFQRRQRSTAEQPLNRSDRTTGRENDPSNSGSDHATKS
jgi:hypothetical protein